MTAARFQEALQMLIDNAEEAASLFGQKDMEGPPQTQTFDEAGIMTFNKGLVVTLPDGSEFQLTIVQSR